MLLESDKHTGTERDKDDELIKKELIPVGFEIVSFGSEDCTVKLLTYIEVLGSSTMSKLRTSRCPVQVWKKGRRED